MVLRAVRKSNQDKGPDLHRWQGFVVLNRLVRKNMAKELKERPEQTAWVSDGTAVQRENCKFKSTDLRACWTYIKHSYLTGVKKSCTYPPTVQKSSLFATPSPVENHSLKRHVYPKVH